ncbi:MAG: hypothetical protein GWP03_05810 [Proteobacteria bacterium]|nr:hypothetical protein [Pseudomonadota bacterium]
MNGIQQWLQLFQDVSCFYRQMLMIPLWDKYPNYQNNVVDSLAIFLEGYAFERQGRRPDYFHVAVDSLIRCSNHLTPICVWNNFKQLLNNQRLNHRNNPIYPSNNPDNIQNINNKMSVIEVVSSFQNPVTLSQNIYNLIIHNNDIIQSFNFLRTIRGIGNKIASFYLRDLVVVLNLNLSNVQNRVLLQPIDIWVERTVKYLAGNQNMNKTQVANWIVTNSLQYNLNPEYINMGIWFYCSLIANSEYRLSQSLQNINVAHSLVKDFRSRITNVCKKC